MQSLRVNKPFGKYHLQHKLICTERHIHVRPASGSSIHIYMSLVLWLCPTTDIHTDPQQLRHYDSTNKVQTIGAPPRALAKTRHACHFNAKK